ncbi:MAG: hypothetical protein H0V89_08765 [Deltaproteobacteria bacterium]|nr:hypothetical protein [Deltaproteobacteria bacterium]
MQLARLWAWAVIAATTLASFSPLVPELRGRKGDSFPLSWFPMFASERPRIETPTYILGMTDAGDRVKIDVSFWTNGGFNQGRNMLTTAVKQKRAPKFCASVAHAVARRKSARFAEVTELRIVMGSYDREIFFSGDRAPLREVVVTTCPVRR